MHEVHRPDLVDRARHCQRLRLLAHDALPRLDPEVQFQLPVNAIDALVVPAEPLHIAQVQEAQTEAPVLLVVGQPHKPVGNHRILVRQRWLVAVTGLADGEIGTGLPNARAPGFHRPSGHLSAQRWPYHFFASASLRMSALICDSAYIFFRRRFSSSSSFMREIIEASMPPYLDRQL